MSPPNSSQNRPPGKLRLSSSRFGATAPHTQYFCLFICLLPDPDWKPWSTETLSVLFPSHWTPRSNKERGPSWMLRNILSSSVRWWQKHVSDWWRGSAWCSRESRPSLRCVVIGKAPDRPPRPGLWFPMCSGWNGAGSSLWTLLLVSESWSFKNCSFYTWYCGPGPQKRWIRWILFGLIYQTRVSFMKLTWAQ